MWSRKSPASGPLPNSLQEIDRVLNVLKLGPPDPNTIRSPGIGVSSMHICSRVAHVNTLWNVTKCFILTRPLANDGVVRYGWLFVQVLV